ncbi:ATP-binding protein [Halopenitus sp. H-Gu1]|uniref:sensor histidine kinase n=1 Tax=Halopenitus sp. H-Gu1 TaxID=3242697 RepID=UPI00359E3E1D
MSPNISEHHLMDRIFETSPTGIVVLTPDGDVVRCNQRAQQLLELEKSEIEGKTYVEPEWAFIDAAGERIPQEEHPYVQVYENRGPIFNQEFRMERPHAGPIDLSISGAPIINENGTVERIVFAFEDITDRRERERELRVKNEQLEILNRVVRHDIRNDMAVVLGWLETVEDEIDSDRGEQAVSRMRNASNHVVELTETVHDLVEVVTGEGALETEPIQLTPVLQTSVDIARESYPRAEIEVEEPVPDVAVSATDLLVSIFQNLLNNAVQHNDASEPRVTIAAEANDERVRISIADNGPGIPSEQKRSIFGKRQTGHESESTGIGLYLVETLVANFGGEVRVEDNEPRGSIFIVELQIAEQVQ